MDNINKKLYISEPGVCIGSIDDSNATYELFRRKYNVLRNASRKAIHFERIGVVR